MNAQTDTAEPSAKIKLTRTEAQAIMKATNMAIDSSRHFRSRQITKLQKEWARVQVLVQPLANKQ